MPLQFEAGLAALAQHETARQIKQLRNALTRHVAHHGKAAEWDQLLAELPGDAAPAMLDQPRVCLGSPLDTLPDHPDHPDIERNTALLRGLMPWRKGPWRLFGIDIDTEWRSDLKWARLQAHLSPLAGRRVLDIGSGNGYYLLRMLGDGASFALGVDPTMLFLYQFAAATRTAPDLPAHVLPLRGENLPAFGSFDTVFSMGVLYHRRSPIDHLTELLGFLRPGGELILETLVIAGGENDILVPRDRYAKMANVWFIPSALALENLLRRAGFKQVRTIDITRTTTREQRPTDWMTFESLPHFLDPQDPALTIEGYPAPTRALLVAER